MRNSIGLVFILALMATSGQSQTAGETSEKVHVAIQQNFQQMGEAMAAGNVWELALHFTENALLKLPGMEPLKGRKAIEQAHQQMIEQGIKIKPNTQEVETAGNMAYEIGTYEMIDTKGQTVDQGHYATVWKKDDDQWRIARDIISSTKFNSPVSNEMDHRAVIENVLDLYFQGLLNKNMDLLPLSKDILFVGPTGYTLQGIADVKPFLANTAGLVKEIHIKQTVIEGDYACKITDYDWTNGATTPLAICFRVEDNEITEIRPYFDPRPIVD